jgi:hypothetical protein
MMRHLLSAHSSWVLLLLAVILVCTGSCNNPVTNTTTSQTTKTSPTPTSTSITPSITDKSIVQVWVGENLEATGIVIGDGSQVITIIDYEESFPESINVITPDGDNYSASVQRIDPRTGATLLEVGGLDFPAAVTNSATNTGQTQSAVATWYGQDYTASGSLETELTKAEVTATAESNGINLDIITYYPPSEESFNPPYIRQEIGRAQMKKEPFSAWWVLIMIHFSYTLIHLALSRQGQLLKPLLNFLRRIFPKGLTPAAPCFWSLPIPAGVLIT